MLRSTHSAPHLEVPIGQSDTHAAVPLAPCAHIGVVPPQVVLQSPQLAALERSDSHPFAGSPSQSAKPTWHALSTSQEPVAQRMRADTCGRAAQLVAQDPQCDASVCRSTQDEPHITWHASATPPSPREMAAPSRPASPATMSVVHAPAQSAHVRMTDSMRLRLVVRMWGTLYERACLVPWVVLRRESLSSRRATETSCARGGAGTEATDAGFVSLGYAVRFG